MKTESDEWTPFLCHQSIADFSSFIFVQLGLDSQYIGDGYPYCQDLPEQHFLKIGATYLLRGADPNPELLNDPSTWDQASPKRLSLDFTSPLALKLCNGNASSCTPAAKVVLDSDLTCVGIECDIIEPRTIEVAPGLWFEYVRPPCVNPAFFENAQTIKKRYDYGWEHYACGNPKYSDASTVCCSDSSTSNTGWRYEIFGGERVPLDVTKSRCSKDKNLRLCRDPNILSDDCRDPKQGGCDNGNLFYWTDAPCTLQAKINPEGHIAIVHQQESRSEQEYNFRMVDGKTIMFFRVDWQSNVEEWLDNYQMNCGLSNCWTNKNDGTCQCNVTVSEAAAFDTKDDFLSAENVLARARIGVFQSVSSSLSFVATGVDGVDMTSGALSVDTVFKVVDYNGNTQYRKNVISTTELGNGGRLILRTPVQFWVRIVLLKGDIIWL
jgi:hypothetical protein